MNYRCDVCGCYLDPGEGYICEDCREEEERRSKAALQREKIFIEQYNGQMALAI